jgi:hypothetical protein
MMLEIEEDCGVFQLISRKEAPSPMEQAHPLRWVGLF